MKMKDLKEQILPTQRQTLSEKEKYVLLMPDGGYCVGPGSCGFQDDWDKVFSNDSTNESDSEKEVTQENETEPKKGKIIKRILYFLACSLFFFTTSACTGITDTIEINIPPERFGYIEIDRIEIMDAQSNVIEAFEAEIFGAKKLGGGFETVYRSNASRLKSLHCGSYPDSNLYPGKAVTLQYPIKSGILKSGKFTLKIRYSKHSKIIKAKMVIHVISSDGESKEVGTSKAPKSTGDWNVFSEFSIPIEIK